MMLMVSTMTFAGDSPALKAILKAKTYDDAESLLKSTLQELANDEEKAKAYNKLVDLAMQKVTQESTVQLEISTGIKKDAVVDEQGMCDALLKAIAAFQECYKYDQLPNAKGKIAPKFSEKNIQRIWAEHRQLLSYGDKLRQQDDYVNSLKYWGPYLDLFTDPIYSAIDKSAENETVEQVAYLAAWMANNQKQKAQAIRYAQMGLNGKFKKEARQVLLAAMASDLQTKADSLRYADQLKEMYNAEPESELLLEKLYGLYGAMNDTKAQTELLDATLARDPKNFIALADKGLFAFNDQKYVEAADYLRKASEVRPDNAYVLYYLGMSFCAQAQEENLAEAKKKELYKTAIEIFDKCKEVDPKKEQINWGYGRQNAYYNYYGPNSPEFKAAEADYKN